MTAVVPLGRISRISFFTDMTRADAPVIPLGYMVEAAWPEQARWLGMIGRTRLTPFELEHVSLATWPDLRAPFGMLTTLFDHGWESDRAKLVPRYKRNGRGRRSRSTPTTTHSAKYQLRQLKPGQKPVTFSARSLMLCK